MTQTYEVLRSLQSVMVDMLNAETGIRGYLLTENKSYLVPYYDASKRIATTLQRINVLTEGHPNQIVRMHTLTELVSSQLAQYEDALSLKPIDSVLGMGLRKVGMDAIRRVVAEMGQAEERSLRVRIDAAARSGQQVNAIMYFCQGLILVIFLGAFVAMRRHLTRRIRAEKELSKLNTELEKRVADRTVALKDSHAVAKRNEARWQAVVEHLSESVAVFDKYGALLHLNRAGKELHGLMRDGIHPSDILEFAETVELSGLDGTVWLADQRPVAVLLRGEAVCEMEASVRNVQSGLRRTLSYNGTLVRDEDGEPLMAIATAHDITARKRSEQRIQDQLEHLSLLDKVTLAIGDRLDLPSIFQVVVDSIEKSLFADFCCISLYEQSQNVLKIERVGCKIENLAPNLMKSEYASIPVAENGLQRCISGALVFEPDIREQASPFLRLLANAGLRSLVFAPIRSENGALGVIIVARCTSDAFSSVECEFLRQLSDHVAIAARQAQLYNALQQAYDDLRQTQQVFMQEERLRAIGQMASGIAHDINNALSPVLLYAGSLLETETNMSERARRYLEIIQRAVEDVANTVARMRELYRKREIQMTLAQLDLNVLIGEVLDLTRARWSDIPLQHGIVIRAVTELDSDLPPIMGSESELREALTNLVFNAVDAMPLGGTLTLRTRLDVGAITSDPTRVVIDVEDQGVGMDEETRLRCLEPFFTTKGERGTGLGLAMVFGVVERHSAHIEIISTPGKGTAVQLFFPIQSTNRTDSDSSMVSEEAMPHLHLLLIDDDPVLLQSIAETLELDGHKIVAVNGGEQGIAVFNQAQSRGDNFDAVITDLGMPHVDGRKVAEAVKCISTTTPVILLTGWGQRLVADGDIPPSVDRVVAKPPKLRELRQALIELCCPPQVE